MTMLTEHSSALCIDLRNSTENIRELSSRRPHELNPFLKFMEELALRVYAYSYESIGKEPSAAVNHTGDGFLCVFWDQVHAKTALHVGLEVRRFLNGEIPKLNARLCTRKPFDFGVALHTGRSRIHLFKPPFLKLAYGIPPNTVSKLEKQTKEFGQRVVLTGNFRKYLVRHLNQSGEKNVVRRLKLRKLGSGKQDIEDGKRNGHFLYCVLETEADNILSLLRRER
jgi:hypothetical protein